MWLVLLLPAFVAARSPYQRRHHDETLSNRLQESNSWTRMINTSAILKESLSGKTGNPRRESGALNEREKSIFDVNSNVTKLVDENREDGGRSLRIHRRHIVPLIIGIALKFLTTIPLIMGKLTILGTFAIIKSKMALLITLITTLGNYLAHGFKSMIQHHHSFLHHHHHEPPPPPHPHDF